MYNIAGNHDAWHMNLIRRHTWTQGRYVEHWQIDVVEIYDYNDYIVYVTNEIIHKQDTDRKLCCLCKRESLCKGAYMLFECSSSEQVHKSQWSEVEAMPAADVSEVNEMTL